MWEGGLCGVFPCGKQSDHSCFLRFSSSREFYTTTYILHFQCTPFIIIHRAAFTTKTVKIGEYSILFQIWDTAGQEKVSRCRRCFKHLLIINFVPLC